MQKLGRGQLLIRTLDDNIVKKHGGHVVTPVSSLVVAETQWTTIALIYMMLYSGLGNASIQSKERCCPE
jgi:hypothetical protein